LSAETKLAIDSIQFAPRPIQFLAAALARVTAALNLDQRITGQRMQRAMVQHTLVPCPLARIRFREP
jgi:hypothetical protein